LIPRPACSYSNQIFLFVSRGIRNHFMDVGDADGTTNVINNNKRTATTKTKTKKEAKTMTSRRNMMKNGE
jgi:hypothetical protein